MNNINERIVCPLTDEQRGVYLDCIGSPETVKYNIPVLFSLPDCVDPKRFIEAVKQYVRANKTFFVTVRVIDGVPSMVTSDFDVEVEEKTVSDVETELKDLLRPFDLERGPLFKFEFLHTPKGKALLFDVHHIIYDGTSLYNTAKDICEIYDRKESDHADALTIFDLSRNKVVDEEKKKAYEQFLSDKFDGADIDSNPLPDVLVEDPDYEKAEYINCDFGKDLSCDIVLDFVKKNGVTENSLFLSAFAYTIAKLSGTAEPYFTTVHNGRLDKRYSSALGMFVRTLPMRCSIDENMKVADFITGFNNDYYYLKQNDCISFSEIASKYGLGMGFSFVFQSSLFKSVDMSCGKMYVDLLETNQAVCNLDIMVFKNEDHYSSRVHYRPSLYTEEFARRFSSLFEDILKEFLKCEKLADIKVCSDRSKLLLDNVNSTEVPYKTDTTVVELFRSQAKETPDNICVVFEDKKYTYKQVDEITDRIARYLVKQGAGKEKVIGILIPRCEHMVICSLASLKAGAAYMPLDPSYPAERLNLMMNDSGAFMLICAPQYSSVIGEDFKGIRISTDDLSSVEDCDIALCDPCPSDLFVMLYTSGSTGLPKGVMFEHSNTLVTTEFVKKYYGLNEQSKVTSYASYGFDAHAYDIYPTITSGAELHVISEEIRLDFPALKKYFDDNGITHTVMTTQIGRQFAQMGKFASLKHLSVAGEKLTPLDPPEDIRMYNLYGPTEGSIITSAFEIDRKYKDIPIGKPVDNLKCYVVDKQGRLLPPYCVGELWISGPHVTRGYLNRPEKTAEAYGLNTFDDISDYERVYRTGDIVRFLPDGNLQFVGRRDAQVKVRGFRVELTEVEEVIRRFDGVKDATIAAFDAASGGKYIAAYIVSDDEIDPKALGDFIRAEKPPYMVPAVVMRLDKIPLNQNGKVNKKALPVPEQKFEDVTPPENDTQQKLFDIIADVIGTKGFGVDTDIYEAGLSSIGAVRLCVDLSKAFDAPIKITDIKQNPTVRKLEAFFAKSAPAKEYALQDDYPITETQSGIFIECMSAPDTTVYNIPVLIRLSPEVDIHKLADAVKAAINAHPYAKTTLFTDKSGSVRAKRNDADEPQIEIVTCNFLPETSTLVHPFDLLGDKLYRAVIYRTSIGNYLFMDFHHIICDGTSEMVLFSDIDRAYGGSVLDKEIFSGFENALEEEKIKSSQAYETSNEYWKKLLAGCETECLPKKVPENADGGAGAIKYRIEDKEGAIKAFCGKNDLSLNAYFNCVFAFVVGKFINKDSITYSTVYNGRNDSRLERALTMLVKTIPVAANIGADEAPAAFVRTMQTQLLESISNDSCSFAELSSLYGVKADLMLVYQGDNFAFDSLCGYEASMINIQADAAKAPISLTVSVVDDHYELVLEYKRDIYDRAFTKAFARSFGAAAKEFTVRPKLSEVSLLCEEDEEKYAKLNDCDMEITDLLPHELFEKCASENPDAPAVTANRRSITYGEMNEKANIIAHKLISLGIGRGSLVGVVFDRSYEIPLSEIAIMKAGGAFLPVLPTYPDERIEYCLTNADSPFVITTKEIKESRPELFGEDKPYRTLTIEELLEGGEKDNPGLEIDRYQLAYCIYTSGSTGKPKGVMITHDNLVNMVATHWNICNYYLTESKGNALACCSVSFDASIMEIYMPLLSGKHLIMSTEEEFHNPLQMKELMVSNNIESMVGTPSFLSNMVTMKEMQPAFANMKTIIVGAEAFPAALYEGLRAFNPDLQIINGYGPSECTVCCCFKELHSSENITIGRTTGNDKLYVIDRYGNILPEYAVGELIICGRGVGNGYIKLPEKNAASFVTLRGMKAYHSGDLVRLNEDCEIEFGGRIDNQVKLRGFRVELDEIEKVMLSFGPVTQSKVVVRNNGSEDYLVGFFTADSKVDIDALTAHMKSLLTYYMVPAALMQLDAMPLTPNGKIDKNGFPEVAKTQSKRSGRKAPKKSLDMRLCEIFSEVLSLDECYADDNFFEIGGTSLSASKVTMILMSEGIEVKYGDIFDHPTPEDLAEFITERDSEKKASANIEIEEALSDKSRPALEKNTVKYAAQVSRKPLGNVLLTGAVGFLGVHILRELIESEEGHIYCLVRRGSSETPEIRLKTMLIYYFSDAFEDAMRDRVSVIEADITDKTLADTLKDVPFDTVINCAACVKHFSDNDILDRINVHGVENLISICKDRGARLVQISTVSVPGIHTKESYEKQIRMHENELFVIDDMQNKYAISKYTAELRMFDAIEAGMSGKVIRVGNLMGRHSDGEFQVNFETNMFLSGIRGFAFMGKYPISHMTDPMSFSPVDCTARAVVLLAGTDDMFTAFNANSRYGFDEMKIIDACNANGIRIVPTADEEYYSEFNRKLGDEKSNTKLNGLAAYDIKDAHAVDTDNLFTTNILYRIGFSWPLIDDAYLERAINSIMTLDYFDLDSLEED